MSILREIRISEELCAAAESKFGRDFKNVEALLEFVLNELLRDDAGEMDQAEQKIIEDRLRELGYI